MSLLRRVIIFLVTLVYFSQSVGLVYAVYQQDEPEIKALCERTTRGVHYVTFFEKRGREEWRPLSLEKRRDVTDSICEVLREDERTTVAVFQSEQIDQKRYLKVFYGDDGIFHLSGFVPGVRIHLEGNASLSVDEGSAFFASSLFVAGAMLKIGGTLSLGSREASPFSLVFKATLESFHLLSSAIVLLCGGADISAKTFENKGGLLGVRGPLKGVFRGFFSNLEGGRLLGEETISLAVARSLINNDATIQAAGEMRITSGEILNKSGKMMTEGPTELRTKSGVFDNENGRILVERSTLVIDAYQTLFNRFGKIIITPASGVVVDIPDRFGPMSGLFGKQMRLIFGKLINDFGQVTELGEYKKHKELAGDLKLRSLPASFRGVANRGGVLGFYRIASQIIGDVVNTQGLFYIVKGGKITFFNYRDHSEKTGTPAQMISEGSLKCEGDSFDVNGTLKAGTLSIKAVDVCLEKGGEILARDLSLADKYTDMAFGAMRVSGTVESQRTTLERQVVVEKEGKVSLGETDMSHPHASLIVRDGTAAMHSVEAKLSDLKSLTACDIEESVHVTARPDENSLGTVGTLTSALLIDKPAASNNETPFEIRGYVAGEKGTSVHVSQALVLSADVGKGGTTSFDAVSLVASGQRLLGDTVQIRAGPVDIDHARIEASTVDIDAQSLKASNSNVQAEKLHVSVVGDANLDFADWEAVRQDLDIAGHLRVTAASLLAKVREKSDLTPWLRVVARTLYGGTDVEWRRDWNHSYQVLKSRPTFESDGSLFLLASELFELVAPLIRSEDQLVFGSTNGDATVRAVTLQDIKRWREVIVKKIRRIFWTDRKRSIHHREIAREIAVFPEVLSRGAIVSSCGDKNTLTMEAPKIFGASTWQIIGGHFDLLARLLRHDERHEISVYQTGLLGSTKTTQKKTEHLEEVIPPVVHLEGDMMIRVKGRAVLESLSAYIRGKLINEAPHLSLAARPFNHHREEHNTIRSPFVEGRYGWVFDQKDALAARLNVGALESLKESVVRIVGAKISDHHGKPLHIDALYEEIKRSESFTQYSHIHGRNIALLSVAVIAAGIAGGVGGTALLNLAGSTIEYAAASAAFGSAASQITGAILQGKSLTLGGLLKDVAKSVAIAGVTFGLLETAGLGKADEVATSSSASSSATAATGATSAEAASANAVAAQAAAGSQVLSEGEVFLSHLERAALGATANIGVRLAFGEKPQDVVEGALRGMVGEAIGAHFAGKIGKAYGNGEISFGEHKFQHALLGAALGAISDGEKGAISGALAAPFVEIVMESMTDIQQEYAALKRVNPHATLEDIQGLWLESTKGRRLTARLSALALGGLLGGSPSAANVAADNALDHNFIPMVMRALEVADEALHAIEAEEQLEMEERDHESPIFLPFIDNGMRFFRSAKGSMTPPPSGSVRGVIGEFVERVLGSEYVAAPLEALSLFGSAVERGEHGAFAEASYEHVIKPVARRAGEALGVVGDILSIAESGARKGLRTGRDLLGLEGAFSNRDVDNTVCFLGVAGAGIATAGKELVKVGARAGQRVGLHLEKRTTAKAGATATRDVAAHESAGLGASHVAGHGQEGALKPSSTTSTQRKITSTTDGDFVSSRAGDLAVGNAGLLHTDFAKLARRYAQDMEMRSGVKLDQKQVQMIEIALRSRSFEKLGSVERDLHRSQFRPSTCNKLIAAWEKHTGQKWPRYERDSYKNNGDPLFSKGDPVQAHHIIHQSHEGPHAWWNIHPMSLDAHQRGVHLRGAPGQILHQK